MENSYDELMKWNILTLADAYMSRPPLEYVAGMLEQPSLNVFYGAPGTLKSFLLADLAVCAALGRKWLEPMPGYAMNRVFPMEKEIQVGWYDLDNGDRRTLDRFAALGKAYQAGPEILIRIVVNPIPRINGGNSTMMENMANRIKSEGTQLVFIDNLGLISGGIDENSSQMVEVMANLRQLATYTGASVNLIHHKSKGSIQGRKGDSMRGHSSIEAAIDLGMLVERMSNDVVRLTATKARGKAIESFKARFTYLNDPMDNMVESRFYGMSDEPDPMELIRAAIHDEIGTDTMNKTQLLEKVRARLAWAGINRIRKIMDALINEGSLDSMPGQKTNEVLVSWAELEE